MTQRRFEDTLDLSILGAAIALSIGGLAIMMAMADSVRAIIALGLYGITLIVAYTNAALYHHAQSAGRAATVFQALDHSTIFLLIAGTYTPFCLLIFQNHSGWHLLGLVWGMAAAGIGIRVIWMRRPYRWAPVVYLAQGWVGIPWARALIDTIGYDALILILAGGIAYSTGIAFFLWRSFRFSNPVWHLFVVAGSTCHFIAILFYVMPYHASFAGS